MTTADTLSRLWEEMTAPSASAFLKALRARGVKVREKDVREFVSSKSERQILSSVRYTGKVNACCENDRWAADLINFTSRPATRDGKKYAQVLFVQDSFTRFIYTVPMTTTTETGGAFETLLKQAKQTPRQLDTDRGSEFSSNAFQAVCDRYDVFLVLKDALDLNGLARMDNAIGQLKKAIRRLQEIKSGDWLTHLEHATSAFNMTPHGATDAPPNDLPASVVLEQSNAAAQAALHNMREIDKRKDKLQKLGEDSGAELMQVFGPNGYTQSRHSREQP